MSKEESVWRRERDARQEQEAAQQKRKEYETVLKENGMLDEIKKLAASRRPSADQLFEFTLRAAKCTDAQFAINFVCKEVGDAVGMRVHETLDIGQSAPATREQAITRLKDALLIRFAALATKLSSDDNALEQRATTVRSAVRAVENQS